MLGHIDTSLIDWSRAQFALTAIYHWIFVPLTLGLAVIMGIMETVYYRTGDKFWKHTAKFWMKLFGINFAIGVAKVCQGSDNLLAKYLPDIQGVANNRQQGTTNIPDSAGSPMPDWHLSHLAK